MADDDLAAEIAWHRPSLTEPDRCRECWRGWPCLVRRLADESEAFWREIGRLTVVIADRDCELRSVRGERDALLAAGQMMADDVGHLLHGGFMMKPTDDGPMTFEAVLMLIQMLGAHRDAWRALAPAVGEDAG